MKRNVISIFAGTLLLVMGVYSQSDQQKENQLTLTMVSTKTRVLLLEPIPLKFGIENRTNDRLPLKSALVLQNLKFSVEKPDGTVVEIKQTTHVRARIGGGTGDIPAGAKHEKKDVLEFQLLKWFDQPGQYRIKASFANGEVLLSSDWVGLTVDEPFGNDAAAFEFLRTQVTEPSVVLAAPPSIREKLIEEFPESPYADYMRYSLAQLYEDRDRSKAIELYTRLQTNPSFIFADEVSHNLKKLEGQKKSN